MSTRFETDTAVQPLGNGRYEARLDTGWWAGAGPNGGYLNAILVHASMHHVPVDRSRHISCLGPLRGQWNFRS